MRSYAKLWFCGGSHCVLKSIIFPLVKLSQILHNADTVLRVGEMGVEVVRPGGDKDFIADVL